MQAESSCTRSKSRRSIFAATALFALTLFTAPAMAQDPEVESFVDCAGTFNPNLSCTSNDIKINNVSQMTEAQGGQPQITSCTEGETGFIDVALTTQLNATERYDVLTWFGTEGNDPRAATIDNCHVSSLPDDPASTFILDLEGGADACLDVNSSPEPVTQYMFQVPFTCNDTWSLDTNGDPQMAPDGETDVFALVTWTSNPATLNCGTGAGQTMEPGLNPKCDVSLLLGLDIEIITNPSVQIVKTPEIQQVSPGGTANFTLTVSNLGDVDLDTVVVTDDNCDSSPALQSGDTGDDLVLGTDETWVYTCSKANVQAGFTNTAGVTAEEVETENEVSDEDTAQVSITPPAVMIVKSPDQVLAPGGTANFTLTVTNEGDVDLNNVSVTDPLCDASPVLQSGDVGVDGVLSTTETWTYTCSTANVQAGFTNTANVTADPVGGGDSVNDSDTASVTVVEPAEPDVPIPTLGQWLLVFLAALLLGTGLMARRGVLGRK